MCTMQEILHSFCSQTILKATHLGFNNVQACLRISFLCALLGTLFPPFNCLLAEVYSKQLNITYQLHNLAATQATPQSRHCGTKQPNCHPYVHNCGLNTSKLHLILNLPFFQASSTSITIHLITNSSDKVCTSKKSPLLFQGKT